MAKYKLSFSKPVKWITTKIFDIFRIFTLKQQKFSQSDPPIFKELAVRSSPDPARIGFSPDPVLICVHLW